MKKILIIGGGYGGLKCAKVLEKKLSHKAEITLVSRHDYHYQTTLLHKVACGTYNPRKARIFYRNVLDTSKVNFVRDNIDEIDFDARVAIGQRGRYEYDYIVIALGFEVKDFGIKGVKDYAFWLGSVNTALKLNERIEKLFKDYIFDEPAKRENDLKFAVVGSGFTGVEFAAELAIRGVELCKIRGIDPSEMQITLISRGSRILPMFDEKLSKKAVAKLASIGVKIVQGNAVEVCEDGVVIEREVAESNAESNSVLANAENGVSEDAAINDAASCKTASGAANTEAASGEAANSEATSGEKKTIKIREKIPAKTVLWSAGVKGSSVVGATKCNTKDDKIIVNANLKAPEFDNVFVVGDSALATSRDTFHAPTAQLSEQMGEYVAKAIIREVRGEQNETPFAFFNKGTVCSIGHTDAVGVAFKVNISGEVGAFLKNFIENKWLFTLGGLKLVLKKGQFRFRSSD